MSKEEREPSLTIGDRINYPYLLANQIQALINIQKKEAFEEEEIQVPINSLLHLIPNYLRDEAFEKELEEAKITETVDLRPSFGGVSLDDKVCEELGLPVSEKKEKDDPYKILLAIMNLLQRRKMLLRTQWIEEITGLPFKKEEKEENE